MYIIFLSLVGQSFSLFHITNVVIQSLYEVVQVLPHVRAYNIWLWSGSRPLAVAESQPLLIYVGMVEWIWAVEINYIVFSDAVTTSYLCTA